MSLTPLGHGFCRWPFLLGSDKDGQAATYLCGFYSAIIGSAAKSEEASQLAERINYRNARWLEVVNIPGDNGQTPLQRRGRDQQVGAVVPDLRG